jgi:hypothetical protein
MLLKAMPDSEHAPITASRRRGVAEQQQHALEHLSRIAATRPDTPMCLIVTKWDLMDGSGVRLHQVRDHLLQFGQIQAMSAQRRAPLRLLPVSAVGPHSVTTETLPDGTVTMVKQFGDRSAPINLDAMLATLLLDGLFALPPARRSTVDARHELEHAMWQLLNAHPLDGRLFG